MSIVRTIFTADNVAFAGDISIALTSNGAKKERYTAVVTDGADILAVADESANIKVFKDAGAAIKFIGKFCTEDANVTVDQPLGAYVPNGTAGDPATALAKAITHTTAALAKATAIKTKVDASVTAATALGWATGTAPQQAKLAEDTVRAGLVAAFVVDLQAKLTLLQA